MSRAESLARLPALYSLALQLRDAGLSEDRLVERLGIEPEALGALLEIAAAKLEALLDGQRPVNALRADSGVSTIRVWPESGRWPAAGR